MCSIFTSLASFRYADTLLMFFPMKDEPDVTYIAKEALAKGKRIAYPKCSKEDFSMVFHFVNSPAELVRGAYGIMEPPDDAPVYTPGSDSHDVCIIPALAFDICGNRLGYGKGYYDRWLPFFSGLKAGVAISDFVFDALPHGKFDCLVDIIVTEKGVIIRNEA